MKKQMIWFLSLVFSGAMLFSSSGNIYLLGYPRSGNHWFGFCVEAILNAPNAQGYVNPESKLQPWGHRPLTMQLDKVDKSQNYLIVILRNYRECMMRQLDNDEEKVTEALEQEYIFFLNPVLVRNVMEPISYPYVLKWYDEWDASKRFLVYYEDLMNDPETVLKEIIRFLGKDEFLVDRFMAKFEELKAFSYRSYCNPQSRTVGLNYHTSLMTPENIVFCDNFMKSHYPDYWYKYLSQYESKSN